MKSSGIAFTRRDALAFGLGSMVLPAGVVGAAEPLTLFAAASLKEAFDALAASFFAESGIEARISYAASSQLARQIAAGAPADIFISADLEWMDWLDKQNDIDRSSRRVLLGNTLVLVAKASGGVGEVKLGDRAGFVKLAAEQRLVIAEPESVPAGRYARQAMEHLGLWSDVQKALIYGANVRAALALVARDEAGLAIVYATDAAAEPRVRVVARFDEASHQPILYPIAKTRQARVGADAFLAYVGLAKVKTLFEGFGFRYLLDSRA